MLMEYLSLVITITLFLPAFKCTNPIVETPWGHIQGISHHLEPGYRLKVYLGIPYAIPPVGFLRFRRTPLLQATHKGVYHADHFRFGCMQTEENAKSHTGNGSISENCLFLNIWTPHDAVPGKLYPVLVYIHGSAFVHGSTQNPHAYGDYLSAYGDIVVVTMDHRLAFLGSAYGGNNSRDLPGNMGIHDVVQSLHWVHENIRYFGGNPDQVTLSGMSAGSIIASFIFISQVPDGLFNKVVLMSGVSVDPVTANPPTRMFNYTKKVSELVGCSRPESMFDRKEIRCLKQVEAEKLVSAFPEFKLSPMHGDTLMPLRPQDQLTTSFTRRGYSILIGTEQNEDVVTHFEPNSKPEAIKFLDQTYIPSSGLTLDFDMKRLIESYFEGIDDNDIQGIRKAFHDCVSDIWLYCPSFLFGELFAKQNQVHFYRNEYKFETLGSEGFRASGTVHCDDSFLFLGTPFQEYERFLDADRAMSVKMMKLLASFVKNGNLPWPRVQINGNQTKLNQWNIRDTFDFKNIEIPSQERCYQWAKYLKVKL